MKLLLTCLAGLAAAADPVFHDEAPTAEHVKHFADGTPAGRGYDDHTKAAPTRAPQTSFEDTKDWASHEKDAGAIRGNVQDHSKWTFAPSPIPTPAPTFLPTPIPTPAPTAVPTRDHTRVIKTCTEVGSPDEVVWYNSAGTICTGEINKESCPGAKRCLLEKGTGADTYTSTCSHVHCTVKEDDQGRKVTKVNHHHAEKYGSMHICQQGLHKDYGHANHCGCECFDELAGDNDWLTGLAHRNLATIYDITDGKIGDAAYTRTQKNLRVHKKVSDRKYLGHKDMGGKGEVWSGEVPDTHDHDQPGYENHKGVTMFGYNN